MLPGADSAIPESVFRATRSGLVILFAVLGGLHLCAACSARGPRSPEEAYERLAGAVAKADADLLFGAVDQQTRWSWMTVQKTQREAFDIVLSNFPEGEDRERKLRHLETGATAETAADLFGARMGATALKSLQGRLPKDPQFKIQGKEATVPGTQGTELPFLQVEGRWGYSGFMIESEEAKKRAIADLELIKISATDYERARARQAP